MVLIMAMAHIAVQRHSGARNEEIKYYYPTTTLVTAPDIIFFWVARMIIAGYEFVGEMPFKNVYFTGIVRDKIGRKMSKQFGNSPDPFDLIAAYGADGVRMGLMLAAPAGNDVLYDDKLCEQGRNFCNKIWNAFRLVKGWEVADMEQPESSSIATRWFEAKLNATMLRSQGSLRQVPHIGSPNGDIPTLLGRILVMVP